MKNDIHDGPEVPAVSEGPAKKFYTKPELIIYGTVETLTENSRVEGNIWDYRQDIQAYRSR